MKPKVIFLLEPSARMYAESPVLQLPEVMVGVLVPKGQISKIPEIKSEGWDYDREVYDLIEIPKRMKPILGKLSQEDLEYIQVYLKELQE
jgi:hypothetical protein